MRSEEEFKLRFMELRAKRLAERKEKYLGRNYMNCESNVRKRLKGRGKCGFCQNEEVLKRSGGGPFVCDEEGTATKCPLFQCRNTEESVESDFEAILRSPARCGEEYPKLAVLLWGLQKIGRSTRNERFNTALSEFMRSFFNLCLGRWW